MHILRISFAFICTLLVVNRICVADVYVDAPEPVPAEDAVPGFTYFLAQQITADDNLFRLPAGLAAAQIAAGVISRNNDRVDEVSAGINELWVSGRQTLTADLRLNHDDYAFNKFLDNTSWNGHLLWNWSAGSQWTGQLGIDHDRRLLDFAYTRELAKDIVDSGGYLATGRFQIDPEWSLTASARKEDISHSLLQSTIFNSHNQSGSFGAEYATSAANTIELQYKYSTAEYPNQIADDESIEQNFHESTTQLLFNFEPSDRTLLVANAGYLRRQYSDTRLTTYSGEVWHASIKWQALEKIQVLLALGRDLEAYVDASTEYFIAKASTITASWTPREKLAISVLLSWEHQDYVVGSDTSQNFLGRIDHLQNQSVTASYTPRDWISFNVSAALRQRNSNYTLYSFDDRIIAGGFKITF